MKQDEKYLRLQHEMSMLTEAHKRLRAREVALVEREKEILLLLRQAWVWIDGGDYDLEKRISAALGEGEKT